MRGRRLAGLAVIVSEMEPALIETLKDTRMPIVFYDVRVVGSHRTSIRANYGKGTQRVVEYLYSLGHRRLAFVGHHTALEPLHTRLQSFLEAVGRYGGEVEHTSVADEDSPYGGQHATQHVFASGFEPTAIVCCNDWMALGAMKGLREMGLSVPEHVSVAGCDNISLSEFAFPPLTTTNVPRDRIGHLISEALMPQAEVSPLWGREIHIEPDLIIRDSTGRPPATRRA
jgi:DNA-binding LacI/PurR family transcriptional regulator